MQKTRGPVYLSSEHKRRWTPQLLPALQADSTDHRFRLSPHREGSKTSPWFEPRDAAEVMLNSVAVKASSCSSVCNCLLLYWIRQETPCTDCLFCLTNIVCRCRRYSAACMGSRMTGLR